VIKVARATTLPFTKAVQPETSFKSSITRILTITLNRSKINLVLNRMISLNRCPRSSSIKRELRVIFISKIVRMPSVIAHSLGLTKLSQRYLKQEGLLIGE
jgi:hypothetical protein